MRELDRLPDAVSVSSTCAIACTKQRVFAPQHEANLFVILILNIM
jgi:hypothetical protein